MNRFPHTFFRYTHLAFPIGFAAGVPAHLNIFKSWYIAFHLNLSLGHTCGQSDKCVQAGIQRAIWQIISLKNYEGQKCCHSSYCERKSDVFYLYRSQLYISKAHNISTLWDFWKMITTIFFFCGILCVYVASLPRILPEVLWWFSLELTASALFISKTGLRVQGRALQPHHNQDE